MKRNHVKVLSLLLAIFVLASGLVGCGSKKANSSSDSSSATTSTSTSSTSESASSEPVAEKPGWQIDTKPITFDAYFNASWFTEKWTTDEPTRTTSYITKKTGISLNLMAPTGNESEKMTTMIASGDVPDIIFSDFWDANTTKMYQAGLFLPLNKLADQYDKAFYNVVKPSQIGWFTRDDGNIYEYPNFANAYENVKDLADKTEIGGDCTIAVRKDIYEAIGKPDMTTPEGFLNAMKMAKEKFPTVDGKPLIPIEMEFNDSGARPLTDYLPQLLALPKEKDGKLYDYKTDPEYIKWLKMFREANAEGLLSKDIFIDKRAQIEEKLAGGRYFIMCMGKSDIDGGNSNLYKANKDNGKYYIPVDSIRNSNHDDPKIDGKIMLDGWMNAHITAKCKDPARAIRFLNYMMGPEGQHDAWFGEEGVIYDMVGGKEVIKKELLDGTVSNDDLVKKYYGFGYNWTFYNSDIVMTFPKEKGDYKPIDDFKAYTAKYFFPVPELNNISLDPASNEGIASNNIDLEWGQTLPKLLLAKSDEEFDKFLNDFVAKRDKLGYAQVTAAVQAKVDANKKKLGLTN